jgi:hypothetical protein
MDGFTLGEDTNLTPNITASIMEEDNRPPTPVMGEETTEVEVDEADEVMKALEATALVAERPTEPEAEFDPSTVIDEEDVNIVDEDVTDDEDESDEDESDSDEDESEDESDEGDEPVNLKEYYATLDEDEIEDEVELMKVAQLRELYELMAGNCKRYVSIIENYKKENLQSLCNMIVRRIEGHLLVKYRLNPQDRWIEVGFFDEDNDDEETIRELQGSIDYYLKHENDVAENRRKHLAAQFDEEDNKDVQKPKGPQKQAIPDNYFSPEDNPELKVTDRHREAAGYTAVPPQLRELERQLQGNTENDMNLDEHIRRQTEDAPDSQQVIAEQSYERPETPVPELIPAEESRPVDRDTEDAMRGFKQTLARQLKSTSVPAMTSAPTATKLADVGEVNNLGSLTKYVPNHLMTRYTNMLTHIHNHENTKKLVNGLTQQLNTLPAEYHPYIYDFLRELMIDANPVSLLLSNGHSQPQGPSHQELRSRLTTNQREIVDKYHIDLTQL